ncbi:MAG TPA: PD-(D/E)XK nuclease family protein, partial [Acidimicrobiales bacterium]|nr:PD-(D/E)XK nuclease family protein [Acidimicrobiales bacterium]
MPFAVVTTPYGRPALLALREALAAAKHGDPLAPVTVVVPANHVGVTARRLLAAGALGRVARGGAGVAAVTFLTAYRLAELLGAPALAATGRRPVSTPVVAAVVRRALREAPGMFAPVAEHPATETALVATFAELSDLTAGGLDALAATSRRAHDVVALYRRARSHLAGEWYDESELTAAAIDAVRTGPALPGPGTPGRGLLDELGHLVVHLPQDLLQRQAALLRALADRLPATVVAGLTGVAGADAGVLRSLARLGVDVPPGAPAPGPLGGAPVAAERTRVLTASDADDEVRAAVRRVVEAARDGTPLERIGILFGADRPYGRLVHEHLAAAGIPRNGAAVRPLAAGVLGRLVLDLLALPDHDFRRSDVLGVLARAPGPAHAARGAAWERLSRRAGLVSGRADWDHLLARLAREYDHTADAATPEGNGAAPAADDGREAVADHARRQAERARELRRVVLGLIDGIGMARARPAPWSERVAWLRGLVEGVAGGAAGAGRDHWPADEARAAGKIDDALDRLASLDAIDDPPALDVFRRTLELELDADLGRVGRFGEGVLVGPLSFAVGLDLDLVVVLGMAEGTLPAAVRDDSLLPDGERERTGGQMPLRRERVGRDHRRLLAALSAGDRHLLCLPRGDLRATSELVPSRWLADVAGALDGAPAGSSGTTPRDTPQDTARRALPARAPWLETVPSFAHAVRTLPFPATEQEYRLRVGATRAADAVTAAGAVALRARRSRAFTRFDGNLAGVGLPSPVDDVVSATRLEMWAACPFAYFGARLLGVEPVEDPERELQMNALSRGLLVHEVLEQFITDVLARPPEAQPGPDDDWTADDHALIRRIAEQVCDEHEARGVTGRPVFWRRDRAQILAQVDRFLDDDAARRRADRTRPRAAEYRFGLGGEAGPVVVPLHDGRALRFRGSADRIDDGPAGSLVVLDYKTGRPDDYRRLSPDNPDDRGTKLQLAVYAQAARAAAGRPGAPVIAEYWFVSERGGFGRTGYAVDDAVLDRVTATLGTIVGGIERGAFPAHPIDEYRPWVLCPYCDPDGLGVADLRRDWERKRDHPAVAPYAEL